MDGEGAQLDSIATGLSELVDRIAETAGRFQARGHDDVASDLYEVERALEAGRRRLATVVRRLS